MRPEPHRARRHHQSPPAPKRNSPPRPWHYNKDIGDFWAMTCKHDALLLMVLRIVLLLLLLLLLALHIALLLLPLLLLVLHIAPLLLLLLMLALRTALLLLLLLLALLLALMLLQARRAHPAGDKPGRRVAPRWQTWRC